jgi:hypothetical protein
MSMSKTNSILSGFATFSLRSNIVYDLKLHEEKKEISILKLMPQI